MALSDEPVRARELKSIVQGAVRRFGLHIGRFPPVDSLAYHVKTVFHELAIDCVLDVGAHVGEYGRFLRNLGYSGAIVSFEPVKSSYEVLREACAGDDDWHAVNVALGAETRECKINIYPGSVFNSFLPPTADDSPGRFRDELRVARTETVQMRALASAIAEQLSARPAARIFVKTDTQGFDLQVLRGAGDRIVDIQAIQVELAACPMYAGSPPLAQALTELGLLGFQITGMFPVARESDHLRVIEFDCVMCRGSRSR